MFNNIVYLIITSQQSTINNHASRMCLLCCYARPFALRCSKRNESFVQKRILFFVVRLLDIRDRCRVCILPNIRRKDRRDVDGILGMSDLRFDGIAFCVAKPSGSPVVECRHIYIGFATKRLRTLPIPPNDKIRNHLFANPVLTSSVYDAILTIPLFHLTISRLFLQSFVKCFISANNVESFLDFRFNDLAFLALILRRMFPNLLYSTVRCFIAPNHKPLGR